MLTWRLAIPIDPQSETSVYLQIAQGIEAAILEGRLRPGDPLPSTRLLAEHIGISRKTIVAAYQELQAEGWTVGRQGGGTFVADPLPRATPPLSPSQQARGPVFNLNPPPVAKLPTPCAPAVISCLTGAPDPRMIPMLALSRAYHRAASSRNAGLLSRQEPRGLERLRVQLAEMAAASKGLRATPDNLLITSGLKEAFQLLFQALIRPGDAVAVEALGSPTQWEALRLLGARLIPVPVTPQGLDVECLGQILETEPLRLILVTPLRQYPTTHTMGPESRQKLLALALAHRIPIVELDLDPGFTYEGTPAMPLASQDAQEVVVYVGALSKLLFPNLPIAFIHASQPLVNHLAAWRQATCQGGDPLLEYALAELLADGDIQRHMNRLRKVCLDQRQGLLRALARRLPTVLRPIPPAGGLALWIEVLPKDLDVVGWSQRALAGGIAFRPGRDFTFQGASIPFLRLGFGSLDEDAVEEVVRRMAESL